MKIFNNFKNKKPKVGFPLAFLIILMISPIYFVNNLFSFEIVEYNNKNQNNLSNKSPKSALFSPTDNLVGLWSFEESMQWSDGTYKWFGYNNLDGASYIPNNNSGRYGYAVEFFSGSSDSIVVNDDAILDVTTSFSFGGWIFPTSISYPDAGAFIWKDGEYGLRVANGGYIQVYLYDSSTSVWKMVQSPNTFSINTWYHVMAVRTGPTLTLYINGLLVASRSDIGGTAASINPLYFGSQGAQSANEYNGKIDDIRIYNKSLSNIEINSTMNYEMYYSNIASDSDFTSGISTVKNSNTGGSYTTQTVLGSNWILGTRTDDGGNDYSNYQTGFLQNGLYCHAAMNSWDTDEVSDIFQQLQLKYFADPDDTSIRVVFGNIRTKETYAGSGNRVTAYCQVGSASIIGNNPATSFYTLYQINRQTDHDWEDEVNVAYKTVTFSSLGIAANNYQTNLFLRFGIHTIDDSGYYSGNGLYYTFLGSKGFFEIQWYKIRALTLWTPNQNPKFVSFEPSSNQINFGTGTNLNWYFSDSCYSSTASARTWDLSGNLSNSGNGWTSLEPILGYTISSTAASGSYTLSMTLNDGYGGSVVDSNRIITIMNNLPDIVFSGSLTQNYGSSNTLTWTPTDSTVHPTLANRQYSITKNGVIVTTGTWTSGNAITYITANSDPSGSYTYVLQLDDGDPNMGNATDPDISKTVTVTNSLPSIAFSGSLTQEYGSNLMLSWTPTDTNVHSNPANHRYMITKNSNVVMIGTWTSGSVVQYVTSNSDPSGTYTYQIQFDDGDPNLGNATDTRVVTVNEAPSILAAPSNYTAFAGNSMINLSWTAPDPGNYTILRYQIFRSTTNDPATVSWLANISAPTTTYQDLGLTNGITYYYIVRAVTDLETFGENSTMINAQPLTKPAAPTNLVAIPGQGEVILSWTNPISPDTGGIDVPLTGVVIYYAVNGGEFQLLTEYANINSSFVHYGLTNGGYYTYKVAVYNNGSRVAGSGGEGQNSSIAGALPITVPNAPINIQALAGTENVTLTWNPPGLPNEGGINVYLSGYVIYPNPSSTGNVSLSWTAVAGADLYRVYRVTSLSANLESTTPIGIVTMNTYTDTDVPDGHYFYCVLAVRGSKTSEPSNWEELFVQRPITTTATSTSTSQTTDSTESTSSTSTPPPSNRFRVDGIPLTGLFLISSVFILILMTRKREISFR